MSKINEVAELVEKGKAKLVGPAVQEAIDEGDDPVAILNDGMISAMSVVGEKFKNGEIFVPEMLVAARAMKKGVEVLKPHLASGSTGALGKVIIATVSGDLHDIGKNLVCMMVEGNGHAIFDLTLNQCLVNVLHDLASVRVHHGMSLRSCFLILVIIVSVSALECFLTDCL